MKQVVTTRIRLAVCGLSLVLFAALFVPGILFMMYVPLPLAFPLVLLIVVGPPLIARQVLQRNHPAATGLSPAWLVGGAVLGLLCAVALQALTPLGKPGLGESALYSACWLAGIFLGSLREA